MKIAFIGTGLMGYPMAKNLINEKLNLKVFSRTLEKAKPLEKLGATIANSLGEAVREADIVITMILMLCYRNRCVVKKTWTL